METNWLIFWPVVEHYLTKDKFSVGLWDTTKHVSDGTDIEKPKQKAALNDLLIGNIKCKASHMFWNTSDEFTGKGSKKLAKLQKAYSYTSQIEVAMVLFEFFQEYSQGNRTSDQYEADLLELSD